MKDRPWAQAASLCLLALIPGLLAMFFHPRAPSWSRETLSPGEVTLAMALALPNLVWIDARPDSAFAKAHIPAAIALNEDRWNELLLPLALQFRPEQRLVIYCDSLECNASHHVADRLRKELGAEHVYVLKGGWASWQKEK